MIAPNFIWRKCRRSHGIFAVVVSAFSLAGPVAHAQQGSDSVTSRIGRLEQQFLDLQVSVGTLESLLRQKPGAVLPQEAGGTPSDSQASPAAIGDLNARVGALETQIGALTNQLQQISKQVGDLRSKLAATASAAPSQAVPPTSPAPAPQVSPPAEQSEAPPPAASPALAATEEDPSKPHWFGTPTDMPAAGDGNPQPLAPPSPQGRVAPDQSRQAAAGLPSGDAQSLYEQGYGAMLQHDYGAAESTFRQLVAAHPDDPLAGSAQYWIGESYYVRGQYKSAADAFLKGYKKYKSSDKAPDTLLRLGMSLAELGQKDAACSTFSELAVKYPNAPDHVLDEAKGERKRAGC